MTQVVQNYFHDQEVGVAELMDLSWVRIPESTRKHSQFRGAGQYGGAKYWLGLSSILHMQTGRQLPDCTFPTTLLKELILIMRLIKILH